MDLKLEFKKYLINVLKEMNVIFNEEDIEIEIPKDRKNGDISTNIALKLSKKLNKNPMDFASEIVNSLSKEKVFEKVEIAKPGFINADFNKKFIFSNIFNIIKQNENYGKNNIGQNKKVNIEYVSANPTGTLHLGTLRGGVYGDNLANIMSFCGYDVTREYYINDAGSQIVNLGLSILVRYKKLCGINEEMPEDGYYGQEIIDIAKSIYDEHNNKKINENSEYFENIGTSIFIEKIKEDLANIGITFDIWTSEKKIRSKGRIEESISKLEKEGLLYEKEGATFIRSTKHGDDKDRVIIKSDKSYTYLVPDIAYHLDKIDRGYDELIDVLGTDHHGYISRLKASVEALGYDKNKLTIKLLQMVRLIKDNKEIKMSKRTGETIKIVDLYNQIGKDAIRYYYSSRSLDSQIELNLDMIIKKSNENPLYYIQYAYARICSIFNEAKNQEISIANKIEKIDSESAYNLILKVYEFQEIVEAAAIKKEPHIITNYIYDLATLFHYYYSKEKVLIDDKEKTSQNLCIIKIVQITIKNALTLINVSAPEKM